MDNAQRKIRIGVVGTGRMFETTHLPTLLTLSNLFEIKVLCNRTIDRAIKLAGMLPASNVRTTTDYRELLDDTEIDAVIITLPISIQAGITIKFLRAGKHVFQEKPISDNVKEAEEMIALARLKNKVLMIGENFRYKNEFRALKKLIEGGQIGTPILYRLNDLHYTYPDGLWSQTEWRISGEHAGGYLIDGGTHIIAGMSECIGSDVVTVHGLTASFNPTLLSKQPDTLLLHLSYENGMIGQMALGYGSIDHESRKPKIYGTKGTLVLEPKGDITFWAVNQDAPIEIIPVDRSKSEFEDQWTNFHESILFGVPLKSKPSEALKDLRIILSGIEAAKKGIVVRL